MRAVRIRYLQTDFLLRVDASNGPVRTNAANLKRRATVGSVGMVSCVRYESLRYVSRLRDRIESRISSEHVIERIDINEEHKAVPLIVGPSQPAQRQFGFAEPNISAGMIDGRYELPVLRSPGATLEFVLTEHAHRRGKPISRVNPTDSAGHGALASECQGTLPLGDGGALGASARVCLAKEFVYEPVLRIKLQSQAILPDRGVIATRTRAAIRWLCDPRRRRGLDREVRPTKRPWRT
jgi:hypothetical protein